MRRAFPYVLAAAAGAAVFQLAAATAQDRRPLQSSQSVRIFEGYSDRGVFQEALEDASSRALRSLPGADRQVRYKVRDITGEAGGIRGGGTLRVTIEVPGDDRLTDAGPLPRDSDNPRDPRPRDNNDADVETIRRDVRTEVRAPREVDRGDAVAFEFTLTNESEAPIRIPLNSAQKYEFEVWRDNRLVWKWSAGRFFSQQLTTTAIQPDEEVTYRVTWDQRNAEGIRVPAGTYQVRAYVPTRWDDFRIGNSANFTVTGR